ncbi:MAG: hypothetical protein GWO20_07655 [Candidatus Korarchaeota archaeon]|nr:hypothetical protein [Candidatus Korarchaeota archaeon]NIU82394.1 hypothetical protein [Candidatus Thorarchaeota archaeon]NIW12867.1 hypothetical protein [Candidatus Thorarchaeota archaeon]
MMVSTACILGANRIHRYRYASLLALYSVSEKTLQRWQDSVSEEVTKKKLGQIKERVLKPEEDLPEINIEDERTLFFDRYSGRYFRSSSIETVRKIVNDMNDRMYAEDYVSINDFYWGVGLPNVEFGGEIGWNISDGPIKIEFDSYLKDDRPVVTVNFKGLNPRSYR